MNATTVLENLENVRPLWIPADVDFDSLPLEIQAAITGIINPAYRQLVLAAEEGLEQSTGLTVVHLLWLEILQQLELAADGVTPDAAESENRETKIARYLRLAGAKIVSSNFLLRLREFRQKFGTHSFTPDPLCRKNADGDR